MSEVKNNATRHLNVPEAAEYMPLRSTTGLLEEGLPWVIELRVVGTPATINVQVHEAMIIGRSDLQRGIYPAIDLEPHGARSAGVSRQHAVIMIKDNRIKVRDLGSVNGTRLNGYKLEAHQEYRLRHGDELQIGEIKLQVRFAVVPTVEAPASTTAQPASTQLPVVGKGEHVLVVEDDADVATVFNMALQHTGFRVTVMDNGVSALGYITQQFPDVLLLDLMLPDMSGLDLLRYVRKQPKNEDVGVIVCSGATGGFQMSQAKDAGANLCLGKPVSVDDLVKAVASVLKKPQAQIAS